MKRDVLLQRQHQMLSHLSHLPRKILGLHAVDNVTEFVLHDLCQEQCFNLAKAAYFVDNPDFNCTKGVAGFLRDEACKGTDCIWEKPEDFSDRMKNSSFNKNVRSMNQCSLKNIGQAHDEIAKDMAKTLNFNNYGICSWKMKHGNEGFVIYEKIDPADTFADDYMVNGLSFLSFCPIF